MVSRIGMLAFIGATMILLGCGSKGEADLVSMTLLPSSPIVITAPFSLPSGAQITPPWFQFNMTVTNSSPDDLTIVAFSIVATVQTVNGPQTSSPITVSPSDFNFTLTCAGDQTAPITFTSFGTFSPGQTGQLSLQYNGPALPAGCPAGGANLTNVTIYIGGLPNTNVLNYNYSVVLTPEGWFGTYSAPTKRLTKSIYFTTQ